MELKASSHPDPKQAWRERIWRALEETDTALFPGARGRIPNFKGASAAANLLASTPEWQRAGTLKCNPDLPQKPVRLRALREGKIVYVAVPRLREIDCFLELDPRRIRRLGEAATIGGSARYGRATHPRDMPTIDLVVCGSVAIDQNGRRIGKGGGYSDLEFAIGRELGFVGPKTPIATTIHSLQKVDATLPETSHDFRVTLAVTPERILRFKPAHRPVGIIRKDLTPDLVADIPILRDMWSRRLN